MLRPWEDLSQSEKIEDTRRKIERLLKRVDALEIAVSHALLRMDRKKTETDEEIGSRPPLPSATRPNRQIRDQPGARPVQAPDQP